MPTQIHTIISPLLGRTTFHNLPSYASVHTWHKFWLAYQAQNSPHRQMLLYYRASQQAANGPNLARRPFLVGPLSALKYTATHKAMMFIWPSGMYLWTGFGRLWPAIEISWKPLLYYDPRHLLGIPWHRYTMPTQIHAIILPLLQRTTSHSLACYTSVHTWHKFCLAYQAQNSPHREILYHDQTIVWSKTFAWHTMAQIHYANPNPCHHLTFARTDHIS